MEEMKKEEDKKFLKQLKKLLNNIKKKKKREEKEKEEEKEEEFSVELVISGGISHQEHHCKLTDSICDLGFEIRVNMFHSLDDYLDSPYIFEEAIMNRISLARNYSSLDAAYDAEKLAKYIGKDVQIINSIEYVRLFPDNLDELEIIKQYPFIQSKKIVLPIFREEYNKEILEGIIDKYSEFIDNIYVMTYEYYEVEKIVEPAKDGEEAKIEKETNRRRTYVRVLDLYDKLKAEEPTKKIGTIFENRK